MYGQDDWKLTLEPDAELRPAIRDQRPDERRRQPAVVGGPARTRASSSPATTRDDISPDAAALLPQIPISYTTSNDAGWTDGLLRPSYRRFAPRARRRLGARRLRQDRRQRRVRRLPEPVGLQRAAGAGVDAAVLLREDGDVGRRRRPADARHRDRAAGAVPTARSAAARWTGISAPSTRRTTPSRSSASSTPSTMIEVELPALGDCRRRQLDGPERAGAGPRRDRPAAADSPAGEHHGDPVGRLLHLQRRHGPRRSAAVARAGGDGVLHALEGDRRCVGSWRNGVRGQPAAGCAEHGGRGSAGQLRPPASLRRQLHLRAAGHRRQRVRVGAERRTGR